MLLLHVFSFLFPHHQKLKRNIWTTKSSKQQDVARDYVLYVLLYRPIVGRG